MSTDIAVVIPWRSDHGWRHRLFSWVLPQWLDSGYEVCVGVDDDGAPINVARALNRARAQTDKRILVVAAADHIPDVVAVALAAAKAEVHGWAPVFAHTAGVSHQGTTALIAGADVDLRGVTTSVAPFCTALLAVRADVWDEAGGWDERFVGWGCEDTAFRMVLDTLYPSPPQPTATTYALWHEAAPRDQFDANAAILGGYIAASSDALIMREYLAGRGWKP